MTPIFLSAFLWATRSPISVSSPTLLIRVGVRLSATSISQACGLPFARAFPSISASCWRFSLLFRVFCLTSEVRRWPFIRTTLRLLAYLRKQGGTRSSSLNAVAQELLRLCESQVVRLLPQFIPGHLNVLADSLSRRSQVLGFEWMLCPQAFAELLRRWPATIDLFATSMTHRLPVYFSPMYDPMSAGTNAMLQSWDGLQAYAFPPFSLLPRVLAKVRVTRGQELTLVAPFWPQHHWFPDLLELLLEIPLFLPRRRDLLRQPHFHHFHQNLSVLQLTAFRISGDPRVRPASLTQWLVSLPTADATPPVSTTRPSG